MRKKQKPQCPGRLLLSRPILGPLTGCPQSGRQRRRHGPFTQGANILQRRLAWTDTTAQGPGILQRQPFTRMGTLRGTWTGVSPQCSMPAPKPWVLETPEGDANSRAEALVYERGWQSGCQPTIEGNGVMGGWRQVPENASFLASVPRQHLRLSAQSMVNTECQGLSPSTRSPAGVQVSAFSSEGF